MLIVREKLKRVGGSSHWAFVRKALDGETVCRHWMNECFDIPEGTKTIWLSLHTRSATERYEAVIKMCDVYFNEAWPEIKVERTYWDCEALDKLFGKLVGKKLYLQCEYEA